MNGAYFVGQLDGCLLRIAGINVIAVVASLSGAENSEMRREIEKKQAGICYSIYLLVRLASVAANMSPCSEKVGYFNCI